MPWARQERHCRQILSRERAKMATTLFNLGAIDVILANTKQILANQGTILNYQQQIINQGVKQMAVLVDLQGAETRIAADLKRAADMIVMLSQGHTVADADVEAVVGQLKAAADAFDAANPPPAPGP